MGVFILILLVLVVFIFVMPIAAMSKASGAVEVARRASDELRKVSRHLDDLQRRIYTLEGGGGTPSPSMAVNARNVAKAVEPQEKPRKPVTPRAKASQSPKPTPPTRKPLVLTQGVAKPARSTPGDLEPALAGVESEREPESMESTRPTTPTKVAARAIDDTAGWEERIGTKLAVWVGAVALALAGLFLVRYAAQQGWLTPVIRVSLAGLFGLALLGGGEWFRVSMHRIAQGLTAAGVAVLFGTVLSATHLHELIEPVSGFALLIALTGGTVALSLRQGPFVALLGLVGGFLTPAMINPDISTAGLFGYLFLLEAGLLALTRKRNWWWVGLSTMAGGLGWAAVWLAFFHAEDPQGGAWVGLFLLLSITTFVVGSIDSDERVGNIRISRLVPWTGVGLGLLLVAWLLGAGEMTTLEWGYMGTLGAGCLVLGRMHERYFGLVGLAAAMGLAMLLMWHAAGVAPADTTRFGLITLALAFLYTAGAYACLWGARLPVHWATLAVVASLAYTMLGYLVLDHDAVLVPWWAISLGGGCMMTAMAIPVLTRRDAMREGNTVLALLLVGVSAFVALAVPMFVRLYAFGPQWMTIAWALQTPAVAFIAYRLRVPMLRTVVAMLGAIVAARLLINPWIVNYDLGTTPVWNALLYLYGVPLGCFVATARTLRIDASPVGRRLAERMEFGAVAVGFAMVTLMVRHGFHTESLIDAGRFTIHELATYSVVWAVVSGGLLEAVRRWPVAMVRQSAIAIASASMLAVLIGVGGFANPMWNAVSADAVGATIVFNNLLYVVALPSLLAAGLAWMVRRVDAGDLPTVFDAGVLALVLLTLTLFVRHGFHPTSMMLTNGVTLYELTTYSILGLMLGSTMLSIVPHSARPIFNVGARVAIALALVVLTLGTGIAKNPLWSSEAAEAIGTLPVFNGLLYVTAVPAMIVAVIAWQVRRNGNEDLAAMLDHTAFGLVLIALTMLIRHGFHIDDMRLVQKFTLNEAATYSVVWLTAGVAMLAGARAWPLPMLTLGGRGLTIVGLAATAVGSVLVLNPLLSHQAVGSTPVFNWLLYIYGVPGMLAFAVTRIATTDTTFDRQLAGVCGLTTLVLAFVLLSLQVRQCFHGAYLDGAMPANAEWYAYSAAWVVFAVALLVLGILTQNKMLRYASLAVMVVSVGKVFLFETRHLEDLYRVMSFLGLGLSLFGLAYVYQRFVFRPSSAGVPSRSEPVSP